MERLTYKNYIDEWEVKFENNQQTQWSIAKSDKHVKITGSPIDRLAEFEDFMEEQGFESLEEVKQKINKSFKVQDCAEKCGCEINGVFFENEQLMVLDAYKEFNTSYLKKYQDSQKENQKLKDRWNKLKEYIEKEINNDSHFFNLGNESIYAHYIVAEQQVLDFMEKLEKENDDER